MPDEAASAAAVAGLVGDIMSEQEAVVTDMGGHGAPVPVEPGDLSATYARVAAPAPEAGEQTAPDEPAEVDLPNWQADTEGLDFLDEPDETPEPQFEAEADDEEPDWNADPEQADLKKRLAQTEKKLAWERQQRISASKKQWKAEAGRRFPLADVDEIDADSRRSFLRKAAEQHDRYARKVKPITDALEALKREAVAEVKAEARAEAQQAWGRPASGPQTPTVQAGENDEKFDRKKFRSPHELIAAKLKSGQYGPI